MPGLDGFETCRALKRDPMTQHIAVVMVTSLDQGAERVRGLEAGADDFLTKPVDFTTLLARTRSLVRLKRLVRRIEKHRQRANSEMPGQAEMTLSQADERVSNDLNTAEVLVIVESIANLDGFASDRLDAIIYMDQILGLGLKTITSGMLRIRPKASTITEAEIEAILARRKEARASKDFATSDALRDELTAQGVEVMDGDPLGWEWKLA